MKILSFSVTPDLAEEIKKYAAKHGLSISRALRGILENWATDHCLWRIRDYEDNKKKGFLERFFS